MDKLLNDPSVMEQCAKLLENPIIMKQMVELLSNPDRMSSITDMLLKGKHFDDIAASDRRTNDDVAAQKDKERSINDCDDNNAAKYPSGTNVRTSGLSKPEMNGLIGTVLSYEETTGRYIVKLDGHMSRQISVKKLNCSKLDKACI